MLAAILLSGAAMSVQAKNDNKAEVVFTVSPKMSCSNCENKIKKNLRFEKGVSAIDTDLKKQTVTIKYDPAKTDAIKLIKAFAKIGYKAQEVKAKK